MKTFSRQLHKTLQITPQQGQEQGTCCMCGKYSDHGHPKKFGSNFTSTEYLQPGNIICEYCKYLVSNSNEYRRTMFLLTETSLEKFKKKDAKDIIFNLPTDEAFYLYITQTWQKLGYLLMDKAYNEAGASTVTLVMDYDIITYDKKTLKELYELCTSLRKLKIPKDNLKSGELAIHHYRRIKEDNPIDARQITKQLKELKNNPVWELVVYISD